MREGSKVFWKLALSSKQIIGLLTSESIFSDPLKINEATPIQKKDKKKFNKFPCDNGTLLFFKNSKTKIMDNIVDI